MNIHKHVHGLWSGLKFLTPEKVEEQRELLLRVHKFLVAEMEQRKIEHITPLEKAVDKKNEDLYGWDYFETFRNLYPWQIEDAGNIVRVLQEYFCKTVLDVGCGVGWLLALLKGWFEPTGLEPAEAAVEFGQRQHFNIYRGYGEAMPFVDNSFDGIITNHVLEHVAEPEVLIKECARVSKRVSIHIVPLGERKDPTHVHRYETLDELRELGERIEYPTKFEKTVFNNAIIVVSKVSRPLGIFKDYSDVMLIPKFITQVGSSIKKSDLEPQDFDIVVRKEQRDILLETELKNYLKKFAIDKTHWVYNPQGPVGVYLPLFDLVLRSSELMVIKEAKEEEIQQPLVSFSPPKPSRAFYLHTNEDISEMWEDWCAERKIVDVELKYNGFRTIIEKDKDGKTRIFFEGDKTDRSKQFPLLVEDMRKISGAFILDCDFGAIGTDGDPLSRNDLQFFNNIKNEIRETFITKGEIEGKLRVVLFDVLFYKESVTHLPWSERRKILDSLSLSGALVKSQTTIVRSKEEFITAVNKYREMARSEGVVIKDITGQYTGFGGTNLYWAKGKNIGIIKTRISDKEGVKTPEVYSYHHEYKQDDKWLPLGRTLNSKLSLAIGDVVEIQVEEIMPEVTDEGLKVGLLAPVIRKKTTGPAYNIIEIIREGKKSNVLQTNPELDKELKQRIDLQKAVEGTTSRTKEGNIDFKEGWSGTGILQLHIMGLTEEEAKDYVRTRNPKGRNAAHLDFRMLPTDPKQAYWEGGELFDPGNTAKPVKIYNCKIGETRVMGNFKLESEISGHGGTPGKIMRATNMAWLKYGLSEVRTFEPGEAGTAGIGPKHWSTMDGLGTFKWKAGVQDEHFKEFWIGFNSSSKEYNKIKGLDGRIVATFAPLPGPGGEERRVWLFMKPKDQEMKSELFNKESFLMNEVKL